jgi:hypothetical protein
MVEQVLIDETPLSQTPDTTRPVPFTLRVAVAWTALRDAPHADDGELFFQSRAPLTGELALTDNGRDVSFSDIEVP